MSSYGMSPALPVAGGTLTGRRQKLESMARNGANWFFWIAGLSLLNSVVAATGGDINFIFGLGITLLFDAAALAAGAGPGGALAALLINAVIASVFVVFGSQAREQQRWAFVVGMGLYTVDGLIFLTAEMWLNVGAHVFALFFLLAGLQAVNQVQQLTLQASSAPLPATR